MDIQDYFNQKKKLEEANIQLSDNIVALTADFSEYYYCTIRKKVSLQSDKVTCDFNTCVYVPLQEEVFTFNFPVNFNFGSYKNVALEQFNGFGCNTSARPFSKKRALFLMYPEVSFEDIKEDNVASILTNIVFKSRASIYDTSLQDFLQTIPKSAMNFLQSIEFKDQTQKYNKNLTHKEKNVIEKKFNALISRIISDFDSDRCEGFKIEKLLEQKVIIQQKLLHHKLTSEIPISDYKKAKKYDLRRLLLPVSR